MHLLSILLLALSSNLDNFGVGLAYGARRMRISLVSNLIIAVITSCGTLVVMTLGEYLTCILKAALANLLGAGILIATGTFVILQACRKKKKTTAFHGNSCDSSMSEGSLRKGLNQVLSDPAHADLDYSGCIETREALVLGMALTLNNLASGFGAGVSGIDPMFTTGIVFLFSILTLDGGMKIGLRYTSRWLGEKANLAAGLLLVLIGLYELFV